MQGRVEVEGEKRMTIIKVDGRVRTLIENGVKNRHRSMFVIIGDKFYHRAPMRSPLLFFFL